MKRVVTVACQEIAGAVAELAGGGAYARRGAVDRMIRDLRAALYARAVGRLADAMDAAVEALVRNLTERPAPLPLLSQYLPAQSAAVREGRLPNEPLALIRHKVREVAATYARACGMAA
jgi:hypothetical protein